MSLVISSQQIEWPRLRDISGLLPLVFWGPKQRRKMLLRVTDTIGGYLWPTSRLGQDEGSLQNRLRVDYQ